MSRWNKFLPRNSVQRGSRCIYRRVLNFETRAVYANFVARVHTSQDLQGPNQKVSWFIEIFILPTFSQETLLKRNVSHVVSSLPACLALECCKYTFFFLKFHFIILNFLSSSFTYSNKKIMLKNSCIKCVARVEYLFMNWCDQTLFLVVDAINWLEMLIENYM